MNGENSSTQVDFEQLLSVIDKNKSEIYEQSWMYKTHDNDFLCYVVRTIVLETTKKAIKPWILVDDKWRNKSPQLVAGEKPIYGIEQLALYPGKPVLFVEGEKTAFAGRILFPEFNVMTWMGGAAMAKKADLSLFKAMKVYLLPDNDAPGYKAMQELAERLIEQGNTLYMVDIAKLGVGDGWDIADLGGNYGEIDPDGVREFVLSAIEFKVPEIILETESYPDLSEGKTQKPLDTTDNFKHMLQHYKITIRWNMMKRIREITVPGLKFYDEESENASLTYITNLAVKCGLNIRRIDKHLDIISWENNYHPIRDWITCKSLSTTGILNKFLQNVQTTDNERSHMLIKRWMISAVAAVFNDSDFCAQGVLVIQGEPNTHKSSFISSLVPHELHAVKGGAMLDPTNKDSILTLAEYWIAELGELDATFRKADIARLKAHITLDKDVLRRAYASRNSVMTRRTVYAATVNEDQFLVDSTGNRRWWTISINQPINTRHGLDMQQVWREVYDMWLQGESPVLLEDEMHALNQSNMQYEHIDPFVEKIDVLFDWSWSNRIWMNATQVLSEIGYSKPNRSDSTKMGAILSKRNISKKIIRGVVYYHMPVLNINSGGPVVDL